MTDDGIVWEGAGYLRDLLVPIASLKPWPDNPRRGDVRSVRESFERFGQKKPIVVQGDVIVAGHHMVLAALELGWTHIAAGDGEFVIEDDARGFLLADNRTSELGFIDEELLAAQLAELSSYEGVGYSASDRAELEARLAALRAPAQEDDVPLPAKAKSKAGEIYELGPHRLLCGDSRDPESYSRLLGDERAEVMWTDPPYGVGYRGGGRAEQEGTRRAAIANDTAAETAALLPAALAACATVLAPSARFYICAPPGSLEFRLALTEAGWKIHQTLVWVKQTMVLGHSDYHYQHEDVLYGFLPGDGRPGRGRHAGTRWYGGNAKTSVFMIDRPTRSEEHPTMKPVALVEAMLQNSSMRDDLVLDPFAGSGTTLVACERLGRRCAAIELDPRYCDVIRKRYAAAAASSEA